KCYFYKSVITPINYRMSNHTTENAKKTRLPSHLRRPLGRPADLHAMKSILRRRGLHTVCESARCPNIGECFSKPTATFMILGNCCTRRCGVCSGEKARERLSPDPNEPGNIALTAKELGLKHVVVTSVTRDDLPLGGAEQFALTIRALRDNNTKILIEVLTPDFSGNTEALKAVLDAGPDIFNHNLETVKRLYPVVRPNADYSRSLSVLRLAKIRGFFTKSGIMAGFGETDSEVKELLTDLAEAGCDAVTIGQYLKPGRGNLDVVDYVIEEKFKEYRNYAKEIGITHAYSGPFVRSSYNAEEIFER
ncbi:MAG: lipoyl synthase, partial [Deltaproteobacteria bacterium]